MADPASLPLDKRGYAIQALAPVARVGGTIGASSDRVQLPAGSSVVRVSASSDCYILFGTGSVTAVADNTSDLFPKGVEVMAVPPGATHMAVIQLTTGGVYQVAALN